MILPFGQACNDSQQGAGDLLQVDRPVRLGWVVFASQGPHVLVLSGFIFTDSVAQWGCRTWLIFQNRVVSFTDITGKISALPHWDAVSGCQPDRAAYHYRPVGIGNYPVCVFIILTGSWWVS